MTFEAFKALVIHADYDVAVEFAKALGVDDKTISIFSTCE